MSGILPKTLPNSESPNPKYKKTALKGETSFYTQVFKL